eukprot:TRINITY_DN2319_c1_g1_i1.p1 TRINITY_DN2319_c1_g1~~TRINITY_DN2319_c1_g1_i1.p1  ORF type:complete len:461 (+),score=106.24 TRINITY_DN2319_c1_g1_i1:28-1410(+)
MCKHTFDAMPPDVAPPPGDASERIGRRRSASVLAYSAAAAQLKAQGNGEFARGHHEAALQLYRKALQGTGTGDLEAVLQSSCAQCLLVLRRYKEVLVCTSAGLASAPSPATVSGLRWRRALALEALGQFAEAHSQLLQMDPQRDLWVAVKLRRLTPLVEPRLADDLEADIARHVEEAASEHNERRAAGHTLASDEHQYESEHPLAERVAKWVAKNPFPDADAARSFYNDQQRKSSRKLQSFSMTRVYDDEVVRAVHGCFALPVGGAQEGALRRQAHRLGDRDQLAAHLVLFSAADSPVYSPYLEAQRQLAVEGLVDDPHEEIAAITRYMTDAITAAWRGVGGFEDAFHWPPLDEQDGPEPEPEEVQIDVDSLSLGGSGFITRDALRDTVQLSLPQSRRASFDSARRRATAPVVRTTPQPPSARSTGLSPRQRQSLFLLSPLPMLPTPPSTSPLTTSITVN